MQIWSGKIKAKNRLKIGFGKVLGFIWEGSGSVCGVSWALLGPSWPFFWRSKASFFKALIQDRLQEAFWIDFGSILGGFWQGLGGFDEGFGSIWKLLGKDLEALLDAFGGLLWQPWSAPGCL